MKVIQKNTKKYFELREECLKGDKLLFLYCPSKGKADYLCSSEYLIEFLFDHALAELIVFEQSTTPIKTNHKEKLTIVQALYFFYREDQNSIQAYIKQTNQQPFTALYDIFDLFKKP